MNETVNAFLDLLASEEAAVRAELRRDQSGFLLLTAIKEYDFRFHEASRSELSEDALHAQHMLDLGLPRFIALLLDAVPQFNYPTVTFQSNRALTLAALDFTYGLGIIEFGRRLSHFAKLNELLVEKIGERIFRFTLPRSYTDLEAQELLVANHHKRIAVTQTRNGLKEEISKIENKIKRLLRENVFVFAEKFIGYDAHPLLDEYFFAIAFVELQHQEGFDTYAHSVTFGGVTMQKYTLALSYFLSLALKHEAFAEALVEKEEKIRLQDVLTITSDPAEFKQNLIEAVNTFGPDIEGFTPLTDDEASIIIRVLSVRRDNLDVIKPALSPIPFLIEYSSASWITCVSAMKRNSYQYLLGSLRYHFPSDYDRNQQLREKSMQRALRRMLTELFPKLILVDNFGISQNGKLLTDVDFAAVDPSDGTTILFQLKHQDSYGGDPKKRTNLGQRLLRECSHWLETCRKWLGDDLEVLRRALRLNSHAKCTNVRYLILCRNFAHFLAKLDLSEDTVYATWIQFYDALVRIHSEQGTGGTLMDLFNVLSRFMSHKIALDEELDVDDNYHLPGVSFQVLSER